MDITTITEQNFEEILAGENIDSASLPRMLIEKLQENKMKVAVAESCTGGLISKLLTDESGVSAVYDCGVCSYANSIKEKLLNVSPETLSVFGAVSAQTAFEMAQGIRTLAQADMGIATTGVAGPTGGTDEKPVGLVYIGISAKDKTWVIKADFTAKNNNRCKNRQLASALAIYCGFASI